MQDFERLGVFYLGKTYDLAAGKPRDELVLYDSKDLTTHAVCVGMTGSGKTGLCLALLEEAAIDGIPAIIIDPKGDLSNLLLTFPDLAPQDFEPWIDPAEAERAGVSPQEYAAKTAERWKSGLAEWGQDGERIRRLRDAVDIAIYTPGSSAGLPLTVMRSFNAPPASTLEDTDALREAVSASASGLLGLLDIDADPLNSREHILLSSILDRAWRAGESLDLPAIIRQIQSPPIDKIGVMDVESFFPGKDRFELAMKLNNVLGSPGFAAWTAGEPLDIKRLLHTPAGKPRLSILSIAHLSDAERMFFVTIFLSETIAWMRTQSGTSSLRAILYMDEVFGYFPPSANPPSKTPMLTLLKQARAFGLGIVLATQNPVDLDYKGLANCGTWFLGRLQTERDKLRVLDGLEGASSNAGASFDRAEMDRILSGLGNRVFLMNNVHEDQPVVMQTRWAMSYLRGPLTREQISRLMAERKSAGEGSVGNAIGNTVGNALRGAPEVPIDSTSTTTGARPILPPDISERFLARRANLPHGAKLLYRPALLGNARLHFADTKNKIDEWHDVALLMPVDSELPADGWASAIELADGAPDLDSQPEPAAGFADLPAELSRPKQYVSLAKALKDHLYRNRKLELFKCAALKQVSQSGESEADFRVRLSQTARELRDAQVEKLRQKLTPRIAALEERIRKAEVKVEKEKAQASQQTMTTIVSVGTSILGAMFGRKLLSTSNVTRAGSSMRQATRIARERQDIADAAESVEALQEQLAALEADFKAETEKIQTGFDPQALALETIALAPKKSEINVNEVTLVWQPWIVRMDGTMELGV
jgi:hypothetical protein